MPEVVDGYTFLRGNVRYDWAKFFDGQTWKLTSGADFTCKPESVRASAYRAAKAAGVRVRVGVNSGNVYVKADI